ncbi:MAG: hypothetical protein KF780_11210 [Sphingomonas sp.]|nr:hypothetical protein [Sphingomonas sp.]
MAAKTTLSKQRQGSVTMEKKLLEVEELPELATEVAIAGSTKQQEVGGMVCLGVASGIAIYVAF